MADELRWGFRRAGRRRLLISLFFVPFLVAGVFFMGGTIAQGRQLAAVDAYVRSSFPSSGSTQVRLEGVAHRESTVTSPTGKSAVGWVGHVGYEKHDDDGDRTFVAICSQGSFFDVTLRAGRSERRVFFARPGDALTLRSGVEAPVPILDVETMRTMETIPPEMSDRCQGAISASGKSKLEYREGLIAEGDHVELLACTGADGVTPCHRGHDLLTTGTIDRRLTSLRQGAGVLGLFGGVWNLIVLLVVALTLLDTIPQGRRS